jgi:hypothetical protein
LYVYEKYKIMTSQQQSLRSSATALIAFAWIAILGGVFTIFYALVIAPVSREAAADVMLIIAGGGIVFFGVLMLAIGRFLDVIAEMANDITTATEKNNSN